MTLLTATDEFELPVATAAATPMLRLRRAGEPSERSLALPPGKCTVGSSPQCKVCLPSPEVRPLQCLINLEANAASVTRWANGVQLNGRDFSRASLNNGDRLTIGGWELKFDFGAETKPSEAPFEDAADPSSDSDFIAPTTDGKTAAQVSENLSTPSAAFTAVECLLHALEPSATSSDAGFQNDNTSGAAALTFEDSLVQQLWTANFQARRRAKALINGIRAARFHAEAMAADLSAMETELDLARAAYDSHIVNDDRLQRELAEQRKQHEEQLAPLVAQISSLKAELEAAQASLGKQIEEYKALTFELAAAREAAATPAIDEAALSRVAELETAFAAQSQQLKAISLQLQAAQEEQERLAQLYQAESARAASLEIALAELQSALPVAPDETAVSGDPASETFQPPQPAADVWQNIPPLHEPQSAVEPSETDWSQWSPTTETPVAEQEIVCPAPDAPLNVDSPWSSAVGVVEPEPEASVGLPVEAALPAWFAATPAEETLTQSPQEKPATPASPITSSPQPEADYASTSFIDKYRHLLEDDDASSAPTSGRGPVIDDEYLSPAKAQTCDSPADESDEALEAYMANMMRRVRSSSSSFANDPPGRSSQEPSSTLSALLQSASESAAQPIQPLTELVPEQQPISFEELKQATRKVPLASDLAALREIANSTARTAIATHSHRQSRESAITKVIVAITATVSAGYLMASAPAIDTWQFWAGAATCAIGIFAAGQVLVLERRRRRA